MDVIVMFDEVKPFLIKELAIIQELGLVGLNEIKEVPVREHYDRLIAWERVDYANYRRAINNFYYSLVYAQLIYYAKEKGIILYNKDSIEENNACLMDVGQAFGSAFFHIHDYVTLDHQLEAVKEDRVAMSRVNTQLDLLVPMDLRSIYISGENQYIIFKGDPHV